MFSECFLLFMILLLLALVAFLISPNFDCLKSQQCLCVCPTTCIIVKLNPIMRNEECGVRVSASLTNLEECHDSSLTRAGDKVRM